MIFLLLIAVLLNLMHFYLTGFSKSKSPHGLIFDTTRLQFLHSSNNRMNIEASTDRRKAAAKDHHQEIFVFDPNTLDSSGWIKLGLKPFSIRTVMNYRRKGGRFRKPEDIQKIYGLSSEQAAKWVPYVSINQENPMRKDRLAKTKKSPQILEVNRADSMDWLSLPMIGPTLSGRIVAFREKLGGFYSIEQLREVYGMSDSVFLIIINRLRISAGPYRMVSVNQASEEELKKHPYIRFLLARAIFRYREQHGRFNRPEDLLKIKLIKSEVFDKLAPYIKCE